MQQNVVGNVGVAWPTGMPPVGAHEPPLGGVVTMNLELPAFGLPERLPQPPAGNVVPSAPHEFWNVSVYVLIVPAHVAPVDPAQPHVEHARLSVKSV